MKFVKRTDARDEFDMWMTGLLAKNYRLEDDEGNHSPVLCFFCIFLGGVFIWLLFILGGLQ